MNNVVPIFLVFLVFSSCETNSDAPEIPELEEEFVPCQNEFTEQKFPHQFRIEVNDTHDNSKTTVVIGYIAEQDGYPWKGDAWVVTTDYDNSSIDAATLFEQHQQNIPKDFQGDWGNIKHLWLGIKLDSKDCAIYNSKVIVHAFHKTYFFSIYENTAPYSYYRDWRTNTYDSLQVNTIIRLDYVDDNKSVVRSDKWGL